MFCKYLYTFQRGSAPADPGRENRFETEYSCRSPEKTQNTLNFGPERNKIKNYRIFSDYRNKKLLNTTCI